MNTIIIFKLLLITTINPLVNAHENHDHKVYNWSKLKNKTIKLDSTSNVEKIEDKKINNKKQLDKKFSENKSYS